MQKSQMKKAIRLAARIARERPRGWKSLVYNTAMAQMKKAGPLLPPVHLSIEPTNLCNAACPVCETGKRELTRPKGQLDIHQFKTLIDQVWPHTASLLFYFMGEPFLNKHSYEMIRYARSKGIYVETCTNGDLVDPVGVIYSDINQISFQLGGMDPKTHKTYRVNSDLTRVHKNLFALVEERKKHPDSNVQIEVGFIVMRHNEHQVEHFTQWAKEIGVDKVNIIDPCARNMMEAYAYLPKNKKYWFYDEDAFKQGYLKPKNIPNNECKWIWNSIQLNWNGDAVPCCRDPLGLNTLGNVFEEGLLGVWNGKKARAFRESILRKQSEVSICTLCSGYGLPQLRQSKPEEFKVQHHTVNKERIQPTL